MTQTSPGLVIKVYVSDMEDLKRLDEIRTTLIEAIKDPPSRLDTKNASVLFILASKSSSDCTVIEVSLPRLYGYHFLETYVTKALGQAALYHFAEVQCHVYPFDSGQGCVRFKQN